MDVNTRARAHTHTHIYMKHFFNKSYIKKKKKEVESIQIQDQRGPILPKQS